ncbi:MAG: PaaI family thioesterase [Desulfomonilia bacterium]
MKKHEVTGFMNSDTHHRERLEKIARKVNNSPFYRHVNMQVIEFTDTGCIMTMDVRDHHINIWGVAHGGAIASIADSACGISLASTLGEDEFVMTQQLSVQYLKPARKGLIRAEGRVLRRGRNSAALEADIYDEDGQIVAHAHTIHSIRKVSIDSLEQGGE